MDSPWKARNPLFPRPNQAVTMGTCSLQFFAHISLITDQSMMVSIAKQFTGLASIDRV